MSERVKKINEVIKKELSLLISKEVDFQSEVIATVTNVETSKDLCQAKIFVSVFPTERLVFVLKILNKNAYILHKALNKKMFIRRIPKLIFQEEKRGQQGLRINQILDQL